MRKKIKFFFYFISRYIYALFSSVFLFTAGIFKSKNRYLIYMISEHFGFRSYITGKQIIPNLTINEIIPDFSLVCVREPLERFGNINLMELTVINKLTGLRQPRKIFEIGTFDGRTALNIADNTPADAHVYTLDLPIEKINSTKFPVENGEKKFINKKRSGLRYKGTPLEKKIIQLYGDSAEFDFSPYEGSMDFIFVDGSHSYEYALHDSLTALKLLKNKKGVILWHDYCGWKGVTEALNKLYLSHPDFKTLKRIEGTTLAMLTAD